MNSLGSCLFILLRSLSKTRKDRLTRTELQLAVISKIFCFIFIRWFGETDFFFFSSVARFEWNHVLAAWLSIGRVREKTFQSTKLNINLFTAKKRRCLNPDHVSWLLADATEVFLSELWWSKMLWFDFRSRFFFDVMSINHRNIKFFDDGEKIEGNSFT